MGWYKVAKIEGRGERGCHGRRTRWRARQCGGGGMLRFHVAYAGLCTISAANVHAKPIDWVWRLRQFHKSHGAGG